MKIKLAIVSITMMTATNFFLVSCGGGTSAPASTTTLSDSQAEAVAEQVSNGIGATLNLGDQLVTKVLKDYLVGKTTEIDITTDCVGGGHSTVTGTSVAEATDTGASGDITITETFTDCIPEDSDVTLNGSVDSEFSFNFTDTETLAGTLDASIVGTVNVSGNVTDGTCGIGVDLSVAFAAEQTTAEYSGSICEKEISLTTVEQENS